MYYLLGLRAQNLLLLAASYVFYGARDWRFLGLLLLSTGMDFSIGLAMDYSLTQSQRRTLLIFSVGVNPTILGVLKYWNFFVESAGALLVSAGLEANPWIVRSPGYAAALFVIAFVREGTSDTFIYFQV